MKAWVRVGVGASSLLALVALQGCGSSCIDDGWVWQQGVNCEAESVSATESGSASESDAGQPTEASNSNSNSANATETASASESVSDSDTGGNLWCQDGDGDGFGDATRCTPEMMPGAVPNDGDCDDTSADTFPGAAENDSMTACERDEDGDGWGDIDPPPGVDPGTDCADGDVGVHDDCGCTPNTTTCDGDDLKTCNAEGTMADVKTCEFGCDDAGSKCWDALQVDAGPSLCVDPGQEVQLLAMASGGDGMYAYSWTPADTLDNGAIAGPKATPVAVTEYTVAVNDGEGNMGSDTVSVFVKDQALNLSPEMCTVHNFPHEDNELPQDPMSSWSWNDQKKELCETLNAKGSALFCGWELNNATISGTFSVNTIDDDDWVGFMWGIQDTSHFYVFTWKQVGQLATTCGDIQTPAGMQVKVVDVKDPVANPMACVDMHAPADTANSRLLVGVDAFTTTGWLDNTPYTFELTHKTGGEMTIVVRRADNNEVVGQTTFVDTTYASGQFGMYTKSQVNSCFSGFTVDCVQ